MKHLIVVLTITLLLLSPTVSAAAANGDSQSPVNDVWAQSPPRASDNATQGVPTSNYRANSGKTISTEPQPTNNSALVDIILVVAIAIPNLLKT